MRIPFVEVPPAATAPLDCGLDLSSLGQPAPRTTTPPPISLDNWELDRDLRAAERLVRQAGVDRREAASVRLPHAQLHAPHLQAPGWHSPEKTSPPSAARAEHGLPRSHRHAPPPARSPRPQRSSILAWLSLSLGLTMFACGAVLLIWSFAASRSDLWSMGLPLTLIDQAGLVLGLILQLDVLWQSNRETSDTLQNLDGQLGELRHATTMLSTTHSLPAQSFYAHMAEGAAPELLMADLKGQLDLLALKMSQTRS